MLTYSIRFLFRDFFQLYAVAVFSSRQSIILHVSHGDILLQASVGHLANRRTQEKKCMKKLEQRSFYQVSVRRNRCSLRTVCKNCSQDFLCLRWLTKMLKFLFKRSKLYMWNRFRHQNIRVFVWLAWEHICIILIIGLFSR